MAMDSDRAPDSALREAMGPYRVVRVLGRGGMGVVYLAEHTTSGERVALKTVRVADHAMLSSIRREIHALRRIDHPGVVRIVAEGLAEGVPWYAMELLQGRTLRDHGGARAGPGTPPNVPSTLTVDPGAATVEVETSGPLAAGEGGGSRGAPGSPLVRARTSGLEVLRRVCDALAFVHGIGLVHRDLEARQHLRPRGLGAGARRLRPGPRVERRHGP